MKRFFQNYCKRASKSFNFHLINFIFLLLKYKFFFFVTYYSCFQLVLHKLLKTHFIRSFHVFDQLDFCFARLFGIISAFSFDKMKILAFFKWNYTNLWKIVWKIEFWLFQSVIFFFFTFFQSTFYALIKTT